MRWRYTETRKLISVNWAACISWTNQMKGREQKRTKISWKRTPNLSKKGSSPQSLLRETLCPKKMTFIVNGMR